MAWLVYILKITIPAFEVSYSESFGQVKRQQLRVVNCMKKFLSRFFSHNMVGNTVNLLKIHVYFVICRKLHVFSKVHILYTVATVSILFYYLRRATAMYRI